MERAAVDSSNIKSVGYDPATKLMHVEFSNGGVYEYSGIEPHVHNEFVGADSMGSHFAKFIRPHYPGKKL